MPDAHITNIIHRFLQGETSEEEENELIRWVDNTANDDELGKALLKAYEKYTPSETVIAGSVEPLHRVEENLRHHTQAPVYQIKSRKNWLPYAAAVILVISIGTYFLVNKKATNEIVQVNPAPVQNEVAPGGNKATLTLADGKKIVLDSAANGTLAQEGTAEIKKTGDEIIYQEKVSPAGEGVNKANGDVSPAGGGGPQQRTGGGQLAVSYNTMSTPRGGQYKLTLEDGTQVWLNAESSITYPTSFAERERRVSVTGEAYFEVAKDKTKPFIVAVSPAGAGLSKANGNVSPAGGGVREANGGGLEIEVLGTHFNVNTYNEEATKNITLLEGSVRLSLSTPRSPLSKNAVLTSMMLKPGQQGQLNPRTNQLSLAANPDINQVMAWKNGIFNFNDMSMERAMQQLARWYDVEIIYDQGIPDKELFGEIDRNITLNDVLAGLQGIVATYRLEGRKVHVTPLKK